MQGSGPNYTEVGLGQTTWQQTINMAVAALSIPAPSIRLQERTSHSLSLSWGKITGAVKYTVHSVPLCAEGEGATQTILADTSEASLEVYFGPGSKCTVNGLAAGCKYGFVVKAIAGKVESASPALEEEAGPPTTSPARTDSAFSPLFTFVTTPAIRVGDADACIRHLLD